MYIFFSILIIYISRNGNEVFGLAAVAAVVEDDVLGSGSAGIGEFIKRIPFRVGHRFRHLLAGPFAG